MAQASSGLRGRTSQSISIESIHTQLKRLCSEVEHLVDQLKTGQGNDMMKNKAAQASSQLTAGLSKLEQMIDETEGQKQILWRRYTFIKYFISSHCSLCVAGA
jgi:DNA repair exonuclease SbcCD ATPase subunit